MRRSLFGRSRSTGGRAVRWLRSQSGTAGASDGVVSGSVGSDTGEGVRRTILRIAELGACDDPSVGLSFGAGNELSEGSCTGVPWIGNWHYRRFSRRS